MAIQMYGLKNCDTCKKARNWLDRHAVEYRFIDYREQPATPEQLKRWAEAAGGFEKLVNRAGTMVLPFLTLYLAGQFGWSPAAAGRMLALYGAGAIGGAFLGGESLD